MTIWSSEIKELEKLYESFKGRLPDLEKEMEQLNTTLDPNVAMLYSRRCLEVIITDLCECELKRHRKTEPLKGIIDKLNKEEIVPSHIITSMHGLNELSTYGAHPKDFDSEQVKPVLNNLTTIIKWFLKYKDFQAISKIKAVGEKQENKDQDASIKEIPKPKKRLGLLLLGLLSGIVMIALAFFYFKGAGKPTKDLKKVEISIAVLPFKLLSEELDKQYQADGMMDAILLHLQKFKDLRVMSRTSVEQYRGTTKTTHIIGKELDVGYLLEGSFQKFGDDVKLIVQLIDAKEESHVWANEYYKKWSEIFSVQSEVAQTIARELHAIITPEEKEQIEKIPTTNMTAYDLYTKANSCRLEYNKTRDIKTYNKAAVFYRAALELDSTYAKAYIGLAWTYWDRNYWPDYYKETFLDTCLALANKALSFDDQLDEAYYTKGVVYQQNGHIEEALDNYDKALKINPNYYSAYYFRGYIFGTIKFDMVKAIDNYNKALKLISVNRRPSMLRTLGYYYQNVGFYEKAKQNIEEAFSLDGNKAYYFGNLAMVEFSNENFNEAFKLAEEANKIDSTWLNDMIIYNVAPGHDKEAFAHARKLIEYYKRNGILNVRQSQQIGYAFWKVGKNKEAEYYLNQQIKYSESSIKLDRTTAQWGQAHITLAATYAFKGDKLKAYQSLEELNKMNSFPSFRIVLLKHSPMLDNLRNEQRFQTLLKSMEAKYQAEHERVKKWLEEQGML